MNRGQKLQLIRVVLHLARQGVSQHAVLLQHAGIGLLPMRLHAHPDLQRPERSSEVDAHVGKGESALDGASSHVGEIAGRSSEGRLVSYPVSNQQTCHVIG